MSYASHKYGAAAYGGSQLGRAFRADGGIYVPGYDAVYYWTSTGTAAAYGQAAYGGRNATPLPAAGLLALPDPASGVVTVPLWWAYAQFTTLTRIEVSTGLRTPCRDSPVVMPGPSRRNEASNPKARDALTGYTAGPNTTIERLTGLTTLFPYVSTAVRMKATAAGTASTAFSLDPASQATATHGFLWRASAAPTGLRLSIQWYDATSTAVEVTTHPVTTTLASGVSDWTYAQVTVGGPPANGVTGVVSLQATGLPTNGTVDFTARITAVGATVGTYFDGDYEGAAWTGAVGLSYSDISPLVYVTDAEAPLDVPLVYELSNPGTPGYVARSEQVTLIGKNQSWLTHPSLGLSIPVWVEAAPERTRKLNRTVHEVIGRARPIVVSGSTRLAESGSITFITEGFADRDRLKELTSDGSPLLLRSPARLGYDPSMWLSLGDEVEKPPSHYAPGIYKRMDYDFQIVDRPVTANAQVVL